MSLENAQVASDTQDACAPEQAQILTQRMRYYIGVMHICLCTSIQNKQFTL